MRQQLTLKLPHNERSRMNYNPNDSSQTSIANAIKMFSKPISLLHVTQKEKKTMLEMQKTVFLLLKHNILREKQKHLIIRLPTVMSKKEIE